VEQLPGRDDTRPGISLGDVAENQRVLLHDLLRASTSSQGYLKLTGAIRADEVLHDLQGGNQLFGAANYYTTVFGSPEDANWAWMLTGHHMSAIFTIAGDRTAFTPMFTGAQPLQVPNGLYAGWQVLLQDAGRASELLAALCSDQQQVAIIGAGRASLQHPALDHLAGRRPFRRAGAAGAAHRRRSRLLSTLPLSCARPAPAALES
jgi:hypothetical protein